MNSPWHPDNHGVTAGGDIGGDIQAGDSYEVRFVRDDMPGSLITVTVYAVYWDENREYATQTQIEWMVCGDPADPGGTEIWSDVVYDDGALVYDKLEQADHAAREAAENELAHGAGAQGWDGQPQGPWAAQIGTTDATVTVRCLTANRYVLKFSKLPQRAFGPYGLHEAVGQLRTAALLDPDTARDLVLAAADHVYATAKTG
jgi:hypothetical protein